MDIFIVYNEQLELELNYKKTEIMVISKKKELPQCNIQTTQVSVRTSLNWVPENSSWEREASLHDSDNITHRVQIVLQKYGCLHHNPNTPKVWKRHFDIQ